jgi:hypothetical protein
MPKILLKLTMKMISHNEDDLYNNAVFHFPNCNCMIFLEKVMSYYILKLSF